MEDIETSEIKASLAIPFVMYSPEEGFKMHEAAIEFL
jgi:hypothetical protein